VWQFEVPKGFRVDAPSNMDFCKKALRVVADQLRPEDRFAMVAFAQDALLMVSNTPGTDRERLREAVERLDRIDLGDETYMARGMQAGHKQALPGISPDVVSRMIVLTDGYTKDEMDCYTWARQAKKDGIVVSTMGLGLDFNQDLLISLADTSGGHAYFVEDPAEIPEAFRQELARAQSVSWRDLSLSLALPAEVTIRRGHRVTPTIAPLQIEGDAISLGDLESQGKGGASVLLELVVPPRSAGAYRLAEAALRGRPTGRAAPSDLDRQDVVVRYTERPTLAKQTDAHLMEVIQRVSAFKLQNQAMEDAQRGNIAGATRRLRAAGERLIDMGQEDLGQTMLVEADLMEKEGQMSSEGTKKLRYGTRKLR